MNIFTKVYYGNMQLGLVVAFKIVWIVTEFEWNQGQNVSI